MKVSLLKRRCPTCRRPVRKSNPRAIFCSARCASWTDPHLARARELGLPAVTIRPRTIYERDNQTCHLCGTVTAPPGDVSSEGPTLDHVIPFSTPGSPGHVPENVRTAHRGCNTAKGDRPLTAGLRERIRRRPRVTQEVAARRVAERVAARAVARWSFSLREKDRVAAIKALEALAPTRQAS